MPSRRISTLEIADSAAPPTVFDGSVNETVTEFAPAASGVTYPNDPSWAKAREISATGEVNITWSEVETDVDGHPVNGQISYSILEVNGNDYTQTAEQ